MRFLSGILLSLALASSAYGEDDALDLALKIANAGAFDLALRRVEQSQPGPDDARWAEWEALRFNLLARLDRPQQTLQRAAALPADVPRDLRRKIYGLAAQAAIKTGAGKRARDYLMRLLWQFEPGADEQRALRMLVIDSYFAENKGEEAYRAMLRYQQDYQPLAKAEAAHFVEALLAQGLEQEAVNWLAQLDEGGALKLMLTLKAGLLAPDAVAEQARAAWQKSSDAAYAAVLLQAAGASNDALLRVEALEHQANAKRGEFAAGDLWRAYRAAAPAVANRNHLLSGDDAGWLEAARKLPAEQALAARTLFAYLSTQAPAETLRLEARRQLLLSLVAARHGYAALRLFESAPAEVLALLDEPEKPDAYLLLGEAEQRNGDHFAAAEYFLQAAGGKTDAYARAARLAAAESLLKGGYLKDALAQYDALSAPAKPAAKPKSAKSSK